MSTKKYVPKSSAKQRDGTYGPILKLGFHADTLIEFVRQNKNAAGYINFEVMERREPSAYGDTHSVSLDTFVPERRESRPLPPPKAKDWSPGTATPEDDTSVPF